jgi:hypothetical protein
MSSLTSFFFPETGNKTPIRKMPSVYKESNILITRDGVQAEVSLYKHTSLKWLRLASPYTPCILVAFPRLLLFFPPSIKTLRFCYFFGVFISLWGLLCHIKLLLNKSMLSLINLWGVCMCVCSAGDGTQSLEHNKQMLCHWVISPAM